ncbi:hypothetical protein E3N88_35154 [Mikania micrantha]|uniref:Uncharacterized protein n=1 Tax=Mikania micrantha TaxID=192012 RepID=A0A5N6M055_9ASTR|nr:hypothetical protein E3N88_35154 [Mikania micrantha]
MPLLVVIRDWAKELELGRVEEFVGPKAGCEWAEKNQLLGLLVYLGPVSRNSWAKLAWAEQRKWAEGLQELRVGSKITQIGLEMSELWWFKGGLVVVKGGGRIFEEERELEMMK